MSRGSILVLGKNSVKRMARFCVDYDKPESTFAGKMFDGFGTDIALPHSYAQINVFSCYLAGLDFDLLQIDLMERWPYVVHILLPDDKWLEVYGGEGYRKPDQVLVNPSPETIVTLLREYPDNTLISSFVCHF